MILGSAFCRQANTSGLTSGYGEFQTEVAAALPEYSPESVNLDGWEATQNAWRCLFPGIVVMRCFLHVVLGIQDRCRSHSELFRVLTQDLWHLYHSLNPAQFGQRLRRLWEWAFDPNTPIPEPLQIQLLKLKSLTPNFKQTFQHPDAARTSNAVDRVMNYQNRVLFSMQYFHGTEVAARQAVRAMAILWNFHPYIPKVQNRSPHAKSPFEALNGFCYHEHWLRNLLIAASLNGRKTGKFIPHKIG